MRHCIGSSDSCIIVTIQLDVLLMFWIGLIFGLLNYRHLLLFWCSGGLAGFYLLFFLLIGLVESSCSCWSNSKCCGCTSSRRTTICTVYLENWEFFEVEHEETVLWSFCCWRIQMVPYIFLFHLLFVGIMLELMQTTSWWSGEFLHSQKGTMSIISLCIWMLRTLLLYPMVGADMHNLVCQWLIKFTANWL